MRIYVRVDPASTYEGPYELNDVKALFQSGKLTDASEGITYKGQSLGELKRSTDWRPIREFLGESVARTAASIVAPASVTADSRGSVALCVLIGLVGIALGSYLLLNPGIQNSNVVNFQRLYIGQTACICGAIFLAVAMRPR